MDELNKEEMETIRKSVKEFIDIIDVNNSESPTKQINIVEKDTNGDTPREYTRRQKSSPQPSKLVNNYKQIGVFDEATELLIDNGTFPKGQFVIEPQGESSLPRFEVVERDMERGRPQLKDRLRDVAGKTMDYNQGIEFSEDAFEDALKALLRPWLVSNTETHVLIPLYGIGDLENQFDLEIPETGELEYTVIDSEQDSDHIRDPIEDISKINYDIESAANIEISEISISSTDVQDLTAFELSDSSSDQTNRRSFPSHKIKLS